jgi:hypothetical protein
MEEHMSRLEVLSKQRPVLLLLSALAFAAWQGTELGFMHSEISDETGLARFIAPVAITVWICTSVGLLAPFIGRRKLASEDEMTRYNRLTAFNWGYGIAMIAVGAALILASRTDWPAIDIVRLILIAGVVAPMLRFALMELRSSDGE